MLWLSDVRSRIAPPRGWVVGAAMGWVVAALCALAMRGLSRLVKQPTEAHSRWLARTQGDLALVALGTLLATNAFLVAALLSGFLL